MILFIEFRKAFDLVNSEFLIRKLFHYGLSNDSFILLQDYSFNRRQIFSFKGVKSEEVSINIGVPQGSIRGPLLFLIFINDLPFAMKNLESKLFADDSTFYSSGSELDKLILKFSFEIDNLFEWCEIKQMDIN